MNSEGDKLDEVKATRRSDICHVEPQMFYRGAECRIETLAVKMEMLVSSLQTEVTETLVRTARTFIPDDKLHSSVPNRGCDPHPKRVFSPKERARTVAAAAP